MCCERCSVRQQKIWVFSIGLILVAVGLFLIFAWPAIIAPAIDSHLTLQPGSTLLRTWERAPSPIYLTFYVFNWTNPEEVINPKVKPHFKQLGPYTFVDYKTKEDFVWNDQNRTETYLGRRKYTFVPEMSEGSLDTLINVPDFPTIGATKIVRRVGKIAPEVLKFDLDREGEEVYRSQTAIEFIFDGFYDLFLDFVERLHTPLFPISINNFSYIDQRINSETAEGLHTVHSGRSDRSQLGKLKLWNGTAYTGYWEGECGHINGSTGDLWAPGKHFDENLSIFLSEAARFLNIFPVEEQNFHGLAARLYESTNQTFDSGHVVPNAECSCVKRNGCRRNGVVDFSPIVHGRPIYLSHPHFYLADERFLVNTTGLHPNKKDHGIEVLMEPKLGVPLRINGKVMISTFVERDDQIDHRKDLAWNFYAPLSTISLHTEISDDLLRSVKIMLSASKIGQYVGGTLAVIGAVLIATGLWVSYSGNWRGEGSYQVKAL